jgi:hypothetical protein
MVLGLSIEFKVVYLVGGRKQDFILGKHAMQRL